MAKPRVFVSSTYYDLKHLRSALEGFIESFGFEPVLSEKGNIAYAPDLPLDESCYGEAEQADIFMLIVGGRYGSERSGEAAHQNKEFFTRYDSITREEFRAAVKSDIPIYVLIERAVHAEYHTFLKNREATDITYAHVDSVNIFRMIDEILSLPRNNPVFTFDRYHEIEVWLREQWASLFRELLQRTSSQEQLASLASQVSQLGETNKTLRKYLESLITHVAPTDSKALIDAERKRHDDLRQLRKIKGNDFVGFLQRFGLTLIDAGELLNSARSAKNLLDLARDMTDDEDFRDTIDRLIEDKSVHVLRDINKAREELGLRRLTWGMSKKKAKSPSKNSKS